MNANKEAFARTKAVIEKFKDILKCQLCSKLKHRDLVIYYKSCGHFFCIDCNNKEPACLLCSSGKKEFPLSLATDDEKVASLYDNILHLKLPTRQEIKEMFESQSSSVSTEDPFENVDQIFKTPTKKEDAGKKKSEQTAKGNGKESCKRKLQETVADPVTKRSLKPGPAKKNTKDEKQKCETPLKTHLLQNKNSKGSSTKKKLNVTKTNCKGETPLHISCKKGDISQMKILLDGGADINAKDAAGWTPLHDAVDKGKIDVIKFLLENGANVNTPGSENITALHEAVTNRNAEICKLLVQYGADKKSKDIRGDTPVDIARELNFLEIRDILLHTNASINVNTAQDTKYGKNNSIEKIVLWKCQLDKSEEEVVGKFVQEFNCESVSTYSYLSKTDLTHIVIPNDGKIPLNFSVLSSIFSGSFVVNFKWAKDCLKENKLLPVEGYIPEDEFYEGFKKSRLNKLKGNPGLFSGCHFFFGGVFENYIVKDLKISKSHLKCIVEKNGGVILKRSPDPERATERTVPFHASDTSSIAKTSYFIIYHAGKWDPAPIYNMNHLKTLPIEWLIVCILSFQLLDPVEMDVFLKKFSLR